MRAIVIIVGILLFSSYFLIAQVKEDIILRHQQAMGGQKNWQGIKTITTLSERYDDGMTIIEKKQMIPGKAIRIDYTYKTRANTIPDDKYFVIVSDNKGWKYLPDNQSKKTDTLTSGEIKYYKNYYYFNDPLLYNNPNAKTEYLGKENIEGKECYKFSVSYPIGITDYLYIEANTYLLFKSVHIDHDSEIEWMYGKYQKISNSVLQIPYEINNEYEQVQLKEIKINTPIPENIFKITN